MKFALLLVLTAVVAVSTSEVADPSSTNRINSLSIGTIAPNDMLLQSFYVTRGVRPTADPVDVTYTAPGHMRIAAVRAQEEVMTLFATVRVVGGGVGWNFVTLRFTNSPRRGFNFHVRIFGRRR